MGKQGKTPFLKDRLGKCLLITSQHGISKHESKKLVSNLKSSSKPVKQDLEPMGVEGEEINRPFKTS